MSDLTRDAEGSRAAKIALRGRLLTARRHLDETTRRAAAQKIQDQTLDLVRREHPSTIAAYVPIDPEPGGPDLPAVLARHARVLLPVLLPDGDLDWAPYTEELTPGPRGLLEPPGPFLGADAIRASDLILVPALAVDHRGIRMGRGGGSYDRALSRLAPTQTATPPLPTEPTRTVRPAQAANPTYPPRSGKYEVFPQGDLSGGLPRPLIVALLHDGELVDEVPAEPHDRAVHAVLTPGGGFTLSRAGLNPAAEWTK
jgi:5-formyltetrahydrofolate cyclo-ligase